MKVRTLLQLGSVWHSAGLLLRVHLQKITKVDRDVPARWDNPGLRRRVVWIFRRGALPLLLTVFLCLDARGQEHVEHIEHNYFIGNSLTMSTTLDRVHGLFAQRGIDLQFGSQLSGGKSLLRHWLYAEEPDQDWICWETFLPSGATFLPHPNFDHQKASEWRFGRYDKALAGHTWDAVVFQPYLSPLDDDLKAVEGFVKLALPASPRAVFSIYQVWPNRPEGRRFPAGTLVKDIDYQEVWLAPHAEDGKPGASRAYFKTLLAALDERNPELRGRFRLIPVGEVLFVLDQKIKDGTLPGLAELAKRDASMLPGLSGKEDFSRGVNLLYADTIHFNEPPHQRGTVGNFVSGTTLFTVLTGQNPVGLSAAAYGLDDQEDSELIRAIQETIWAVVTADPSTGVPSTR